MNPGIDIVKELEELASPLAKMPRVTPFQVPENYFANLTQTIREAISYEDEPGLDLPKELPFAVPEGYFKSFASSLMERIAEEPAFETIASPQFEVPAGYFINLPAQMLAAAKATDKVEAPVQKRETKVISFRPRKVLQWAAAACLIAAVGIGGYRMMDGQQQQPLSAEKQLAMLDKSLIRSYISQHIDEFDTEMLAEHSPILNARPEKNIKKLNEEAINEYLDEGGI